MRWRQSESPATRTICVRRTGVVMIASRDHGATYRNALVRRIPPMRRFSVGRKVICYVGEFRWLAATIVRVAAIRHRLAASRLLRRRNGFMTTRRGLMLRTPSSTFTFLSTVTGDSIRRRRFREQFQSFRFRDSLHHSVATFLQRLAVGEHGTNGPFRFDDCARCWNVR